MVKYLEKYTEEKNNFTFKKCLRLTELTSVSVVIPAWVDQHLLSMYSVQNYAGCGEKEDKLGGTLKLGRMLDDGNRTRLRLRRGQIKRLRQVMKQSPPYFFRKFASWPLLRSGLRFHSLHSLLEANPRDLVCFLSFISFWLHVFGSSRFCACQDRLWIKIVFSPNPFYCPWSWEHKT